MKIHTLAFLLLFQFPFAFDKALEFPHSSLLLGYKQQKGDKPGAVNLIFKSADGGQTWQDISEGLPENLPADSFVEHDSELYISAGNGIYHSKPNSTAPLWKKEIFPEKYSSLIPGKTGIVAYNYNGQFLQKINGTSVWSPMYTNLQEREVRTFFESDGGAFFVGYNNGLFKSTNSGKTWKPAQVGDARMKLAESNGVLLSTSKEGILRSTDDGQNWDRVLSEGGVGIAVERIDGGFAAIVNNTITQINSLYISMDNGKTWGAIGEDLQPSWSSLFMKKIGLIQSSPDILSIKQMGKYLICSRSDGIFRSSDMGKTWQQLLLPSTENFGFNLSVSGNVIYVMPNKGC